MGRPARHGANRGEALRPRRDSVCEPLFRLGIPVDELSLSLAAGGFVASCENPGDSKTVHSVRRSPAACSRDSANLHAIAGAETTRARSPELFRDDRRRSPYVRKSDCEFLPAEFAAGFANKSLAWGGQHRNPEYSDVQFVQRTTEPPALPNVLEALRSRH